MAPPLTAELATSWIEDGTAERILESRRQESNARLAMAQKNLPAERLSATSCCHHTWLELPPPWRAGEFTAEARRRGVIITPSDIFAAGRIDVPEAVRICIGMPRYRKQLAMTLDILCEILEKPIIGNLAIV